MIPGLGGGNWSPFVSPLFDILGAPVGNVLEFVDFSAIISIPRSLRWMLLILKLLPIADNVGISLAGFDALEVATFRCCPRQAIGVLFFLLFLFALLPSSLRDFGDDTWLDSLVTDASLIILSPVFAEAVGGEDVDDADDNEDKGEDGERIFWFDWRVETKLAPFTGDLEIFGT